METEAFLTKRRCRLTIRRGNSRHGDLEEATLVFLRLLHFIVGYLELQSAHTGSTFLVPPFQPPPPLRVLRWWRNQVEHSPATRAQRKTADILLPTSLHSRSRRQPHEKQQPAVASYMYMCACKQREQEGRILGETACSLFIPHAFFSSSVAAQAPQQKRLLFLSTREAALKLHDAQTCSFLHRQTLRKNNHHLLLSQFCRLCKRTSLAVLPLV